MVLKLNLISDLKHSLIALIVTGANIYGYQGTIGLPEHYPNSQQAHNKFLLTIQSHTNISLFLILFYVGSAVAVEHIFSGSCDTISLRHTTLNPETIQTLMLVKQQLCLAHTAVLRD